MKIQLFLIGLSFLAFIACKEESKNTEMGGIDLEAVQKKVESKSSGVNACLLAYADDKGKLITEEEILNLSGFSKDKLKIYQGKGSGNFAYEFKNGRKTKKESAIGGTLEVETLDRFSIDEIKPMTEEEFKQHYRPASDEELDYAKEAVKKEINDETTEGLVDDLTHIMSAVAEGERRVNNLGDLAVYNIVSGELKVLTNGVMFRISAKVSDDDLVNRKYAFEMAQIILDKCK